MKRPIRPRSRSSGCCSSLALASAKSATCNGNGCNCRACCCQTARLDPRPSTSTVRPFALLTGFPAEGTIRSSFPMRREIVRSSLIRGGLASVAAAPPDVRIHDLRHSFASVGVRENLALATIGSLLGHFLPETTARYAHLADDIIAEAAQRVSGGLAETLGLSA